MIYYALFIAVVLLLVTICTGYALKVEYSGCGFFNPPLLKRAFLIPSLLPPD
jgi:hypothetical protein